MHFTLRKREKELMLNTNTDNSDDDDDNPASLKMGSTRVSLGRTLIFLDQYTKICSSHILGFHFHQAGEAAGIPEHN